LHHWLDLERRNLRVQGEQLGPERGEPRIQRAIEAERMLIDPDGTDSDRQLRAWIEQATEFVELLPAKPRGGA
jgi:hypothetical protein